MTITFVWRRETFTSFAYSGGAVLLTPVGAGHTIVRCHIRWGFHGDTPVDIDIQGVANSILTMGLVTTIGDGTETPPNPRTASGDAAPPTQRWIYWETRSPVVTAIDSGAGIITWRDSGATEPTDTKGQVLAQGIPSGDTLNLWATWAPSFGWDASGSALVWGSASILVDDH